MQERSKKAEEEHSVLRASSEARIKHLEARHQHLKAQLELLIEQLREAKDKVVKDHLNSSEFQNDLVEVLRPTYLLGFTAAADLAAQNLSEEAAEEFRNHDNYNPDARKLASIMA